MQSTINPASPRKLHWFSERERASASCRAQWLRTLATAQRSSGVRRRQRLASADTFRAIDLSRLRSCMPSPLSMSAHRPTTLGRVRPGASIAGVLPATHRRECRRRLGVIARRCRRYHGNGASADGALRGRPAAGDHLLPPVFRPRNDRRCGVAGIRRQCCGPSGQTDNAAGKITCRSARLGAGKSRQLTLQRGELTGQCVGDSRQLVEEIDLT